MLNADTISELKELTDEYPYFQTARLLEIKNYHNINDTDFKAKLSRAAAYVTDRRILYELIYPLETISTKPEEPETEKPEIEKTEIEETEAEKLKAEEPVTAKITTNKAEKNIKATLQENIAQALADQLDLTRNLNTDEAELVPEIAFDISKEYGFENDNEDTESSKTEEDEILLLDDTDTGHLPDADIEEQAVADIKIADDLIDLDDSFMAATPDKVNEQNQVPEKEISFEKPVADVEPQIELLTEEYLDPYTEAATREKAGAEDDKTQPGNNVDHHEEIKHSAAPSEKSNFNKIELIDRFIEASPRITPNPETVPQEDISVDSVKEDERFLTETLAKIYIKQGYYAKAIFAYEKLLLKYPEKSTYFADQIEMIKKMMEDKTQNRE